MTDFMTRLALVGAAVSFAAWPVFANWRRKILLLVIAFLAAPNMFGAVVVWDAFEQFENNFYYYGGPTPEIGFSVLKATAYIIATADGPINAANPRAYWVRAEKGEIVNDSLIGSGEMVLDAYYSDSAEIKHGSVTVMKDSTFYLALIVDDAEYYGWLAIDVDKNGKLALSHSVLCDTEGVLVVGAIPEPSAGMLLLLGLVGLALRRRR